MYQFYKEYSSKSPKADDYEQTINTLNMQVAQLRRQNLFLRKKLQRIKPDFKSKPSSRRPLIQQPLSDSEPIQQASLVCLLKQLAVIRQNLRRVFPTSMKNIKPVNFRVQQIDCQHILQSGLSHLCTTKNQSRYRQLLKLIEQYRRGCRINHQRLQSTFSEAADFVRRLNQVLVVRMTRMRRRSDMLSLKIGDMKVMHEEARGETERVLKDMGSVLQGVADRIGWAEGETGNIGGSSGA